VRLGDDGICVVIEEDQRSKGKHCGRTEPDTPEDQMAAASAFGMRAEIDVDERRRLSMTSLQTPTKAAIK